MCHPQVSLLACGRLMFHGPCADMLPWFTSLGYSYTKGRCNAGSIKPDHGPIKPSLTAQVQAAPGVAVRGPC